MVGLGGDVEQRVEGGVGGDARGGAEVAGEPSSGCMMRAAVTSDSREMPATKSAT